jgi:2-polyprenyl-3-methyl-5-hydroxy-6-metoxy-1,4-benzoquinol methylase
MMRILKSIAHRAGQAYVRKVCLAEFESQKFSHHNERPIEYRFALQALAEKRPQTVLDVGTGTTAWPHLLRNCGYVVSAADNVRDYWPDGMVNRHWTVLDVDIVNPRERVHEQYDAITCISVLEHIPDHVKAVRNMVAMLKPGGLLVLTTPYSHLHPDPNVYDRQDALYGKGVSYICRSSSAAELQQWIECGLRLEHRELWRLYTGPVWATGERCEWSKAQSETEAHQLGCFSFVKQ